ncbi:hypothetical protein Tco_1199556, partial [Tanacetum coccineum]
MDAHIPNLQLKLLCILSNVTFHEDPETYEAYAYMTLHHVLALATQGLYSQGTVKGEDCRGLCLVYGLKVKVVSIVMGEGRDHE